MRGRLYARWPAVTRTEKSLVAFVCLLLAVLVAENVAIVWDTMLNPVRVCSEGKA